MTLIRDVLSASGDDISAAAVAERIGISRSTAQRYLSDLARDGRVQLTLRYGSDDELVVMAWPDDLDGRKFHSEGALYSGDNVVAVASANARLRSLTLPVIGTTCVALSEVMRPSLVTNAANVALRPTSSLVSILGDKSALSALSISIRFF